MNETEALPYNGEESELRDVFEDELETNSNKIVINENLENIFDTTQLVAENKDVKIMEQVISILNTQNGLFDINLISSL